MAENDLVAILENQDQAAQQILENLEKLKPPVRESALALQRLSGPSSRMASKAIVLYLTCSGHSVYDISLMSGLPTSKVAMLLAEAISEAYPLSDIELIRKHELLKLENQEKVCWERLLAPSEDKEEIKEVTDPDGNVTTIRTVTKTAPNPIYHRIITEIQKRRDALLGLSAPVKIDKTEKRLHIKLVETSSSDDADN